MNRSALILAALFLSAATAVAQPLRFYIGPTLGVTTPGLRSQVSESGTPMQNYYQEKRTPIVSPLVGLSMGFNVLNRLGIDAGVHYSHTGYRYSYDFSGSGLSNHYDEKMTLHKVSVPVTVGYAIGLGRARMRIGAGIAYTYYFAGKFKSEESTSREGSAAQYAEQVVDLISNREGYSLVYPKQIHPRMSLSIAPTQRIIIGLAGTLGYNVTLPQEGTEGEINRSDFSTHALDFSVTYSLRE
jgi:hypothetical protein